MASGKVNAVYYPSWRVYKDIPPSKLPVDKITHIFYAFAKPSEDGSLKFLDEYADTQIPIDGTQGCLAALAAVKRAHPHLRTLLSIGGGADSSAFPILASSAAARTTFVQAARAWVDTYGFDGIDIDWEHPTTAAQGAAYLGLLRACRAALPRPRYLVTTALPAGGYCLSNLDLPAVGREVDMVNLMGYDFAGPWTAVAGHHALLLPPPPPPPNHAHHHHQHAEVSGSCHDGVQFLLRGGVPAEKIVLGVPAYARFFPGAKGPGQAFAKEAAGEIDYCDVPTEWIRGAKVDLEAGTAWFVDEVEGGKGFVSLDTVVTVRVKAGYVASLGLGGVFFWTGAGDGKGDDSLVSASWDMLKGEGC